MLQRADRGFSPDSFCLHFGPSRTRLMRLFDGLFSRLLLCDVEPITIHGTGFRRTKLRLGGLARRTAPVALTKHAHWMPRKTWPGQWEEGSLTGPIIG